MDETFVTYSHKGKQHPYCPGKKRGTPASKRGLSDEKVCLLTGVERLGSSILKAFNLAKPTSKDILHLKDNIQDGSYVWTDGLASYNDLISQKHCEHKSLVTTYEYDKVNHLNNVNSFHQKIQKQYETYKGVASKYINRYAALFTMQRECAGMDPVEMLLYIKSRLKKISIYFYIRQITTFDIFDKIPARFA